MASQSPAPEEITAHYASGYEADRLQLGAGRLENERSRQLLTRFLPPVPARILDAGGGPGGYACWLAAQGYQVYLMDITPLHVAQAKEASQRQPATPLDSLTVGDARSLPWKDESMQAVLLFGPLYHLTDVRDRMDALIDAYRVLMPGGVLIAVGISRFASTFDGLRKGYLKDALFAGIVSQDLQDGQHRNPTGHPDYFMDTFFHHPDELRNEIAEAGFTVKAIYGVEGPGWLLPDFDEWWQDQEYRERLLQIARTVETEPTLLGVSAHLLAVAKK
jgi:ubiquinone/menaquinone biosynthesis C-methylase UbiE